MYSKTKIDDFNYPLPEGKIAFFPINKRDNSKLLVYNNENIVEDVFNNISKYLPDNAMLVFNNTRVVKARLNFFKPSGAKIEIFCLEPPDNTDIAIALQSKNRVEWNCLVGNSRRWTSGGLSAEISVGEAQVVVNATRMGVCDDYSVILFEWNGDYTFADILENFGTIPLPPYIHRNVELSDNDRYQTVYAAFNGSVAAPTAGLHFTPALINSLKESGVDIQYLTLHVGLGTFKPVSEEFVEEHKMHSERIVISRNLVEKLLRNAGKKSVVPVGTTSCRSLESLFWIGVKFIENPELKGVFSLEQMYPYQCNLRNEVSMAQSLEAVIKWFDNNDTDVLEAYTSLMITTEYKCRIANAIITNFHQPKSTLLLLISSFIGDNWRNVYDYALNHDFRFLSYGDSCLFFNRWN